MEELFASAHVRPIGEGRWTAVTTGGHERNEQRSRTLSDGGEALALRMMTARRPSKDHTVTFGKYEGKNS
ncbi:hypothetical protein OG349_20515 [Streptomyces sp. NBC_01317]|uniref:hypothetical protein n=1 Tax=Streptomyces sp. NBC_01317 TaxID=2903822 RepID=UPI002E0EC701|nr:hypothetical protein OG349_20515 [Streptomyces sp. NBC_01317]